MNCGDLPKYFTEYSQVIGLTLDVFGFALIAREWLIAHAWQSDCNIVDRAAQFLGFEARSGEMFPDIRAEYERAVVAVFLKHLGSLPLDQKSLEPADLEVLVHKFGSGAVSVEREYTIDRRWWFSLGFALVILGFLGQLVGSCSEKMSVLLPVGLIIVSAAVAAALVLAPSGAPSRSFYRAISEHELREKRRSQAQ
jgi:hypothetical protein